MKYEGFIFFFTIYSFYDSVTYGSETTVQFTQEEYVVYENDGLVELDVYRTYPDQTATCTFAGKGCILSNPWIFLFLF